MSYFVRAYLRASTNEQDAQRARGTLDNFAHERGTVICNHYVENESGARLDRPELFRLLADSRPADVLLVEDVDRLSRLAAAEWEKLKSMIRKRQVRVVAVNVPTTWQHLSPIVNGGAIPGQCGGVKAGHWREKGATQERARSGPFLCRRLC